MARVCVLVLIVALAGLVTSCAGSTPTAILGTEPGLTPTAKATPTNRPPYEHYAGFVIMAHEDMPIPTFVTPGFGIMLEGGQGETITYDDLDELASAVPFALYVPMILPDDMEFIRAEVIQQSSGDVYMVMIAYGIYRAEKDYQEPLITVMVSPHCPKPSPVFPSTVTGFPEKVNFSPTPGLLTKGPGGYDLAWIENDICYRLNTDYELDREDFEELVASLNGI